MLADLIMLAMCMEYHEVKKEKHLTTSWSFLEDVDNIPTFQSGVATSLILKTLVVVFHNAVWQEARPVRRSRDSTQLDTPELLPDKADPKSDRELTTLLQRTDIPVCWKHDMKMLIFCHQEYHGHISIRDKSLKFISETFYNKTFSTFRCLYLQGTNLSARSDLAGWL